MTEFVACKNKSHKKDYPFECQIGLHDCGIACLKMIAQHFGKHAFVVTLGKEYYVEERGMSILSVRDIAETIGLRALPLRISVKELKTDIPLPAIIFWKNNHFIVINDINEEHVHVSDPAMGYVLYTLEEFRQGWYANNENGVLIAFEPI